jgi:DTW domain-containing protein YfiP
VRTKTRVVLLQHVRERKVAIGTARIAHLALEGSELFVGVDFSGEPRIQSLAASRDGSVAVLFPGEEAEPAARLKGRLQTLIVVDGTWSLAKKLLRVNPALRALPRIGLTPARAGNYRIRKEPAAHCLSTVEAVAQVLSELEGDPERFAAMLATFDRMVDRQIACEAARQGPSRYRIHKPRRTAWVPPELAQELDEVVIAYAEANAPGCRAELRFEPELVHLVAERAATGERFEALVRPRCPLAPGIPGHLQVSAEALLSGEQISCAMERFRAFLGPHPVLATWGAFTRDLLARDGVQPERSLDVRVAAQRRLGANPGGPDHSAQALGREIPPAWAQGRAGQRLAMVRAVVDALRVDAA